MKLQKRIPPWGRHFFYNTKTDDIKLHEDTCIFICTHLNSIMGLFRSHNTVTNFWMLFATLSVFVVAAEVSPEVDREALVPFASEKIFSESAIVAF